MSELVKIAKGTPVILKEHATARSRVGILGQDFGDPEKGISVLGRNYLWEARFHSIEGPDELGWYNIKKSPDRVDYSLRPCERDLLERFQSIIANDLEAFCRRLYYEQ